jgi:hypothetical protein
MQEPKYALSSLQLQVVLPYAQQFQLLQTQITSAKQKTDWIILQACRLLVQVYLTWYYEPSRMYIQNKLL